MIKGILITFIIIVIYIFYTVIPNYIARNKSRLIIRKLSFDNKEKKVALTFDDGPDEQYTQLVLDILSECNIKATFFIVAQKAKNLSHIVERIKQEGHSIAMHSFKHKSAWLSFPWETRKEFIKSLNIFKSLNLDIKYFRPPWGTFNAVSLRYALKNNLKVILWTVEAYDWRKDNTPDNITGIIRKRLKSNDIIVLHDSGGAKGAPMNTVSALKTLIPELKNEGYQFVTIEEGMKAYDYK